MAPEGQGRTTNQLQDSQGKNAYLELFNFWISKNNMRPISSMICPKGRRRKEPGIRVESHEGRGSHRLACRYIS